MGLIQAAWNSASGVLADQWKEFFYCDELDNDVLMVRGWKHKDGNSTNKGNNSVISNGSIIAVATNQCAIIVDQGRIVEVAAEEGEYTYDNSSEPSIFAGSFGSGLVAMFKQMLHRAAYGGDSAKEQRIYYINLKEIQGNTFGTPSPVPFRVVDNNIGLDIDIDIRCNGMFTYQITNPLLFYSCIAGNVPDLFDKRLLEDTMRSEFLNALQPALAKISEMGIRYSSVPAHTMELCDALNEVLSSKWKEKRGIEISSIAFNSINASKEDEEMIKSAQRAAINRNPNMAAASIATAQAEAMKAAASNTAGAANAFMAMNMAQGAGGFNAAQLFQMDAQQQAAAPAAPAAPAANSWTCTCGTVNTGKFCTECAQPKPAPSGSWTCECGAVNTGKFCQECGKGKPAAASYRCNKCGWVPADPTSVPKFCPECGDVFDDNDKQ